MGQLKSKSKHENTANENNYNSDKKIPLQLYEMFDKKTLTKLSGELGKITLNEIENDNGLVFQDKLIPIELLVKILDYIDYKALIICQLVCKQWFLVIRNFVWQRKAERLLHCHLPNDEKALWTVFYAICDKKIPFGRNLVKHSRFDWHNVIDISTTFSVYYTNKPCKAPKADPTFHRRTERLISEQKCWERQAIYVLYEGFPQYILDNLKPIITVSEWYRCRRDSFGIYEFKVELVKLKETLRGETVKYLHYEDEVIHSYHFKQTFENRNHRGTWRKFKYQMKNYEKGLSRIRLFHGGQGHIEMALTSVTLELPR